MRTTTRSAIGRGTAVLLVTAATAVAAAPTASAAPPFSAPIDLLAPIGTNTGEVPAVATADDGTTVAVTRSPDNGFSRVYASIRPAGGAVGTATPISDAMTNSSAVRAGIDDQGNATAVWIQGMIVMAAYRPAGGVWGPPQALSTVAVSAPSLAVAANGRAAVTWYQGNGVLQQVHVAVRGAGGSTFAAPQPVSSTVNTAASGTYQPRVAIDDAGAVTAIWTRAVDVSGTTRFIVETAYRPAGVGTFDASTPRSSTTSGTAGFTPAVVTTPAGRVFAVWEYDPNGSGNRLDSAERSSTTGFGSTSPVAPQAAGTSWPKAAVNAGGTVAVVWAVGSTLYSTVRSPGGAFSAAKALSGPTGIPTNASLALSDGGEGLVAWPSGSGTDYAVFAARRRPGAETFGEVTEVVRGAGTAPTTTIGSPTVALDDEGNGFATFYRGVSTPAAYSSQIAGYDVTPPALTGVSVPAGATAGAPVAVSAAATDRMGAPAYAWDFGDGTTASGAAPTHAFATPGAYTVKVRVADPTGNAVEATRPIQIVAAAAGGGGGTGGAGGGGTGGPGGTGTTPAAKPKAPRITRPKRLKVGSKLSVPSTLKGATKLRFQWLRSGKTIKKATKRTYKVARADRGKKLSCRLTVSVAGKTVKLTTASVTIPKR
jgi:hypothetical protein